MADWLAEDFLTVAGAVIDDVGWLSHVASGKVINAAVTSTRNRPHPWSTFHSYTSWQGLTDRTYLARHLPPISTREGAPNFDLEPQPDAVRALFARPSGGQVLSAKSTCLFPAFAQYLTDGFIRTNPHDPGRTTSNHEIDLCPLYGRTPAQTALLRLRSEDRGKRGRMRTQVINGEEYAPYFYHDDGVTPDAAFTGTGAGGNGQDGLDPPLFGRDGHRPAPQKAATLFAFGGDRANSTPFTSMMNTLLLREHNRLAGGLEHRNADWDDERVFQTARNILIPIYIKLVIEQYINHITPLPFRLVADPSVGWDADWNRPNWMTVEFSLLYRWHSLMPDRIEWADGPIPLLEFSLNNAPLTRVGLRRAFVAASAQPAAEIGALNTADALLPIEVYAVMQARANGLDVYNEYRVAFGMERAKSFEDITSRPEVAAILERLYGTPDRVEFYAGLFAEDRVANAPLPGLLMRMVAVDAFSQALTNPLLSEHVYNARTFTDWGFEQIHADTSLGEVLNRNVPHPGNEPIVLTQATWRRE